MPWKHHSTTLVSHRGHPLVDGSSLFSPHLEVGSLCSICNVQRGLSYLANRERQMLSKYSPDGNAVRCCAPMPQVPLILGSLCTLLFRACILFSGCLSINLVEVLLTTVSLCPESHPSSKAGFDTSLWPSQSSLPRKQRYQMK